MDDNTVHIGTDDKATAWWRWFTRRIVLLPLAAIILVLLGLWVFNSVNNSINKDGATTADQKSLETSLAAAIASANNSQGVVHLVDRLISGQKNGVFTYTDAQLSQLYLDRAAAYLNLAQYKSAVADYEQAIKLDDSNKLAALQGEVEARYGLGERDKLIPLYKQLVALESKSDNPMHNSAVAQYQSNIQALQTGQEISF